MNHDRIAYYTSKITSESMTGVICTMYEMFLEYLDEAVEKNDIELDACRKASRVLEHLKDSLDFSYDISSNLFSLYDYCQREISRAMYLNEKEPLQNAKKVMKELSEAFSEVHKQDSGGAAMSNSQQITAGLTYGRNDLSEVMSGDNNRGFLA